MIYARFPLRDGFTYLLPPQVTAVTPTRGPKTGGTDIQIFGANFVEGIVVTIGGAQVTEVVVISDTLLGVKTPIGETGARDVAVTNPDGQSTQLTGGFSYIALTGDINEDNVVDIFDLVLMSAEFGKPDPDPKADLNDDRKVDVFDLVIIGSQFSQSIAAAPAVFGARQAIRKRVDNRRIRWALTELETMVEKPHGALVATQFLRSWLANITPEVNETRLLQNFPNPFNPETWLPYELKEDALVRIEIYSASGQLVRTLELSLQSRGQYVNREKSAYWDGRNEFGESVASGSYLYMLKAGDVISTRKMVVVK